jgi:glutathione-independent formaldehyde dehydrogenase
VGLLAAHSAVIRGAAEAYVVHKEHDRLAMAGKIGIPIGFSRAGPVER